MKNISKFGFALAVAVACVAASGQQKAPLRNDVSGIAPLAMAQISDANGREPTTADTPLYFSRPCQPGDALAPIIAPDGHQVAWGEWSDVEGRAAVNCITEGSHIVAHFSGLIPNGQYTCWIIAFDSPGFDGNTTANAFTFGPLGLQDGSENGFVASGSGEGQISATLPPGPMFIIHNRDFDGCLTDEFEFHVAIVYHGDGLTHGSTPGPGCTWAIQRAVVFKP